MHAIWPYSLYSLGLLTTLDSHVQILESGLWRPSTPDQSGAAGAWLAVTYLDPPSSSLPLIGSRDSYLATREYFSVFYIVHPAFMLPSDHVFLRYYIMPCDNCVLVLLLLDCMLPLCFRTLIPACTDALRIY